MTRALLAWVPIRGTFWSGLGGGCVTHWRIKRKLTSALAVRTRVSLQDDAWLPGHPSEFPPRAMGQIPTLDDGMPAKDSADVFVQASEGWRGRTISLQIVSTHIEDALAPEPDWQERPFLRDGLNLKSADDLERFQLAPPRRRAELIRENATIGWNIDGIPGPAGALAFNVGALVHFKDSGSILVDMLCDSVYIDLDLREMELVWRGIYVDSQWGAHVERIVLGVLPPGLDEDAQIELLEEGLPYAVFTRGATNGDIEKHVAPPHLRDEEVTMARLSSWEKGPGACVLSTDEFVQISSELSSGPRARVLEAHGFDEIAWSREEWAQSERVANESAELPDDFGDDDGRANVDVKPSRARVAPKKVEIAEYAKLSAHIEVRDPARVLAEVKLSVGEFVALEETMAEALDEDEALASEFSKLLPTYRHEAALAHAADLERLGLEAEDETLISPMESH